MSDQRVHLRRLAARLMCCGFLPEQRDAFDELLDLGLGGAILFTRNAGHADDVKALCDDLHDHGQIYTCVDHEGGSVQRFRDGFTVLPAMRDCATPDRAADAGRTAGRELRAAGIDLNFAPVADVDSNPADPMVGDRSFSADPRIVALCAVAFTRAMQGEGVAACMKHFPGHGDTSQDSHVDLPRLRHDLARLEAVELPPFAACARKGNVAACMSAHVIFEPLDDKPATMSPPTLGLLRTKLGFGGVIFSDCLEMDAIREHYSYRAAVRHGLAAGLDVFLVCHTPQRQHAVLDELVAAVVDGVVPQSRLEESARRIGAMRERFSVSRQVSS